MLIDFRKGEGREREEERNISVREKHPAAASPMCPDQGLYSNLGTHPDRELNPQPFGLWDSAPSH